jgi:hypothetical protein
MALLRLPDVDAFLGQAGTCRDLGSPFSAHLSKHLADVLDGNPALGRAVGGW